MPKPGNDRHVLALLGSLCLFLSAIEYLIPKPLPFMRLGLANLPLLLAVPILTLREFALLTLLKVLGQGIIGGTLFSYVFLFSLAGSGASAAVMYGLGALTRTKFPGFTGLGCAGAMASNSVQLVLAHYFIFGSALRYLVPPFLASGFITGTVLGLICAYFSRRSLWYARHTGAAAVSESAPPPLNTVPEHITNGTRVERLALRRQRWDNLFNAYALCTAGLFMALLFLFTRSLPSRAALCVFFWLLAWFSGTRNNICVTLTVMAGIVVFNLLTPYGKVLAAFGPLRVTQGSLLAGLEKAVTLEGLIMLSRACVKSDLRLPGSIGSLLGESLRILELMRARKGRIRRGHIVAGIDAMLLELESAAVAIPVKAESPPPPRPMAYIVLSAMVLITAIIGFTPAILSILRKA